MNLALLALLSAAPSCPLIASPAIYAEVAVPCHGLTPDPSQPVALNRADVQGGECRVTPDQGSSFYVSGTDLVEIDSAKRARHVGTLLGTPSCYQTDAGDDASATWEPVRLDGTN